MKKLNFIVCVIVSAALLLLVVMLVMSFFTGGKKTAPVKVSEPPKTTATATPPPTDDLEPAPTPSEDVVSPTPDMTPIEGEIIRREAFIGHEKLSITFSSELFSHIEMDSGDQYFLKSDTTNETFIEIVYLADDIEIRKTSFLEPYIPDFTPGSMNMLGQVFVAGSTVPSEGITTTNGTKIADAWLIEVEGGFFAIVAGYSDDDARTTLYKMLDTLEFSL